jgi:uncharacterized protein YbjT (DUF2867 family)
MGASVLVVPGTGKQGRAVCRKLIQRGHQVHAIARDPSSSAAVSLKDSDVTIHQANLDNKEAIRRALRGIDSVFLAIPASPADETRFAANVIEAAEEIAVRHLVLSTVARVGDHESFPGWDADPLSYPLRWYWLNKVAVEARLRSSSLASWTILRPAFFMSNFATPDCERMFPGLSDHHELRVAYHPDTRLHLIDVADIAKFAAESIESPGTFAGKTIPLAAEALSAAEMAQCLSEATGKHISAVYVSNEEAVEYKSKGYYAMDAQIWQRQVGYGVDLDAVKQHGIAMNSFLQMLKTDGTGW